MRLYCPQCHRKYDSATVDICPEDGARLYSLSEKRDDPLVGTVLDGRFRIEAILNKGGMGAVYRATQLSVNREVALKVLRPDLEAEEHFLERFFREARVIAELSHPNVVRLIDFGQDREREVLYLVMELVRGTDMSTLLDKGRLAPALALEVVYQICAALTEPHARGIVHRDLKPQNVILLPISDGTFQVKVLDFGIARTGEMATQLTQTGMICGTPSYMSPEQAQNLAVDARSDLYSLGVMLFEMLTGHLPFKADSGLQVLLNHIQRPAPKLSLAYPGLVPNDLSALVADLMEKSPAARPASAMEVRQRIQDIRQVLGLGPVTIRTSPVEGNAENGGQADLFGSFILPGADPDRLENPETPVHPAVGGVAQELVDTWGSSDEHDEEQGPGLRVTEAFAATLDFVPAAEQTLDGATTPRVQAVAPETASAGAEEVKTGEAEQESDRDATKYVLAGGLLAALLVIAALLFALVQMLEPAEPEGDRSVDTPAIATVPIAGEDEEEVDAKDLLVEEAVKDEEEEKEEEEVEEDVLLAKAQVDREVAQDSRPERPAPVERVAHVDRDSVERDGVESGTESETGTASLRPTVPPKPPVGEQVFQGSVVLESPSQIAAALAHTEITGDLIFRINVEGYSNLEMPNLRRLGGNLILDPLSRTVNISLPALESIGHSLLVTQGPALGNLNAPNLNSIGQNLILNQTQVTSFTLPRLKRVGGMLNATNNGELSTIGLPALEEVGGALTLLQNPKLRTLTTTELRRIGEDLIILSPQITTIIMERLETIGGGMTFNENTALEVLRMSNLRSIGLSSTRAAGLNLINAPNLDELRLTNLREVKSGIVISALPRLSRIDLRSLEEVGDQLNLLNNDRVERIDLSSLRRVGGALGIISHPALERLQVDSLQEVAGLNVTNNPRLSVCELEVMVTTWQGGGWEGRSNTRNNKAEACAP